MTASSHVPYGQPLPGPMPLQRVPAMQAAASPVVLQRPEPMWPMCIDCGNRRGALVQRGNQRYTTGGQVLVCLGGCAPSPRTAATGVITAAMERGHTAPAEIAAAEEDAGLLFHPQAAQEIAAAARDQVLAEVRADLNQAREDRQALAWFHARYKAVGQLCAGRPLHHVLTVSEVLTAIDGKTPRSPLTITWDGVVAGPTGDRPDEPTLVGCTPARGGRAVLVLDDEQRLHLGEKLLATVNTAEACTTPGCGEPHLSPDEADSPAMAGWISLEVAGASSWGGPRWWCGPSCATAAMTAAGAELAAADQLAAIDPDQQVPYLPVPGVVEDDVARCQRCGCTEDHACNGGCHWIPNAQLIDLCSRCATPQELAFAAQGGQGAAS